MIEHLHHIGNCHNEWGMLGATVLGIPSLGYLAIKATSFGRKAKAGVARIIGFKPKCAHTCEDHK